MSFTLPYGLVCFLALLGCFTPFVACWWTYWLVSKQLDRSLIDSLRESHAQAVEACLRTANVAAEVAKGIHENTKPLYRAFDDVAAALVERDPSAALERVFTQSLESGRRNGKPASPVRVPSAPPVDESNGRPPGVKLPSEM